MARFSDMPNEIILELWTHISTPNDVESLAVVSKATYGMATKSLREYHRLKSKYSVIDSRNRDRGSDIAQVLKDILTDPNLALYVKTLSVTDWRSEWDDARVSVDPQSCHRPYSSEDMSLFTAALAKFKLFLPQKTSKSRLRRGDEEPIIILLLLALPNITKLIRSTLHQSWLLDGVLHELASNPFDTHLASLIDVETLVRTGDPLHSSLLTRYDGTLYVGHKWKSHLHPFGSRITHLALEGSNTNSEDLSLLLEQNENLKSFALVSQGTTSFKNFDAYSACAALQTYVRHSLETLTVEYGNHDHGSRQVEGLGNLRAFEVLKTIKTDYDLLVEDAEETSDPYDLVDMLPRSIEEVTLKIWGKDMVKHIRSFTSGILRRKFTRGKPNSYPRLRQLTFDTRSETGIGLGLDFAEVCKLKEACMRSDVRFKVLQPRLESTNSLFIGSA